jgi:TPR repeat protein
MKNNEMKFITAVFLFSFLCVHLGAKAVSAVPTDSSVVSFSEMQQEAEKGNANAQYNLGRMYQNGAGVAVDTGKALEWYTKAAAQGNENAQYNLGVMYHNGDGVAQDRKRGVELISQAAEQGFAWAEYTLGVIYQNGEGVPVDRKKAVEWYTKAAEKGNPKALFTLGLIYENDDQDDKKASEVYMQADEQGYVIDQYHHAWKRQPGDGIPADRKKALEFYKQAAENGYVAAQLYLGWLYFGGIGTEKSDREAYKWWGQAAKKGDENAQHNIVLLCRTNQAACKTDAPNPEVEMWSLVKGSDNVSDVEKFIKKYPHGQYVDSARLLRDQLVRRQQEAAQRTEEKILEKDKKLVVGAEQKSQEKFAEKPAAKEPASVKEPPAQMKTPSPAVEEKPKNLQAEKTKKTSQPAAPPAFSTPHASVQTPPASLKEQVTVKETFEGYKAALFPFHLLGDAGPYSGVMADRIFTRIAEVPGLNIIKSYYKFKGIEVITGIKGKDLYSGAFSGTLPELKVLSQKGAELGVNIAILGKMDIRCKDSSQGTNSCDIRNIEVSVIDLTTGKVYSQTARTGYRPTEDAIEEACRGAFLKFKAEMHK